MTTAGCAVVAVAVLLASCLQASIGFGMGMLVAPIVLVTIASYVLYRQSVDLPALIGMGLIVAGVAVIQLFSKTAGH